MNLVKKLDLKNSLEQNLQELSGGELQRLAVAVTASKNADFYFFDEPSSYNDVFQRTGVARVIHSLAELGKSVMVVEHDLTLLDYLSDYIEVLYGVPAVYGIVSGIMSTKVGINVFLDGFLPNENVRFRDKKFTFDASTSQDEFQHGDKIISYPKLVKKYLGSVVPHTDNFFAALNAAVFSDGSFVYIPKNTRCPMELSTYFRINALNTGQFERTLIIADKGSYVSYLERCTAPMRDENQLHAANVELIALDDAEIKYSTVQNWYPGDEKGKGGIYNFVTKRGDCRGKNSKISWTQVETGSAITWKYPSCILQGDNSVGEFYSVAITNNYQKADTGTKMIHLGKNTKSKIISKGISGGHGDNTYRGLVRISSKAHNSRNYTQCDSLLMGNKCGAHTVPYIENKNSSSNIEHEATTSKISEEQLFYCNQRGLNQEEAIGLIVNGFCKEVLQQLPMEFAVEAQKLVGISLEGSVG